MQQHILQHNILYYSMSYDVVFFFAGSPQPRLSKCIRTPWEPRARGESSKMESCNVHLLILSLMCVCVFVYVVYMY